MTEAVASSFFAFGTCSAAMRSLAVLFVLLALSASALAEPVLFKDCGEPEPARDSRALCGSPHRNPAPRPPAGLGGSRGRPGSASDPTWSGLGLGRRCGGRNPMAHNFASSWDAFWGSLDINWNWAFCRSFLKFVAQTTN